MILSSVSIPRRERIPFLIRVGKKSNSFNGTRRSGDKSVIPVDRMSKLLTDVFRSGDKFVICVRYSFKSVSGRSFKGTNSITRVREILSQPTFVLSKGDKSVIR